MVSPALLTSAEAVAAVAGGAANAAAGVALGPLLRALPFGGRAWKELRTSKTFRKVEAPGMLYVFLGAPFVHSALTLVAMRLLSVPPSVSPLQASLVLWMAGACHGILIDLGSINFSLDVALFFILSTLAQGAIGGWVMTHMLGN